MQKTAGKRAVGLEEDEGCISTHWAGNSEKALDYCKKEEIKGIKFLQSDGAKKQGCFPPLCFCLSLLYTVRIVSHSAMEKDAGIQ